LALALLARARLGRGKVHEASVVAHEAYNGALESLGTMGECETVVRLAYAECLLAARDIEAACGVLMGARERLLVRAAGLGPRCDRAAFCTHVPYNFETLRLANINLGPVRGVPAGEPAQQGSK
jgi:hypothetical protein